jgi:hypothetical protein
VLNATVARRCQAVRLILASSTRTSWAKKQLAQHRSALKHFMRSSCLGEWQTSMDPRMQFAGYEHLDGGPHAHTPLLYKVIRAWIVNATRPASS